MKEDIVKNVKSLPPMPEAIQKIQAICNNPDSSINDLIRVVEKDPALTANLLKSANSPLYGFSREITSISQAVSLFGMATVKGFAIASAVKSSFKMDFAPYGISAQHFIRVSEIQNGLTVRWISKIDRNMLNVLAPTSFLLEVGKVILADVVKKSGEAEKFKQDITTDGADIAEVEVKYFESTGEDVAAKIFEHWNFETLMVDSMKFLNHSEEAYDEAKKYIYPLKAVKKLINIYSKFSDAQLEAALKIVEEAKLDKNIFLESVEAIKSID